MLADVVQSGLALGVGPEPALAAVEPGTALGAPGGVPEGHCDVIAVHPLPVGGVLGVPEGPHPVLTATVAPVTR